MPVPDDRRRLQLAAGGTQDRSDPGFRVSGPVFNASGGDASGDAATTRPTKTRIDLYAEIGGWAGVWPDEFKSALDEVKGGVDLHIHSPGGDAFDGIAIYNMLRQHDGHIDVQVDGLAASAASVIAMAGDSVTMSRGSQLMIHDAWGLSMGNAEDMASMLNMLDKTSDSIASIYAGKAGGSEADWRSAMKAETWYRDTEAVDAGLADQIETSQAAAKNHWDLRVFAHAGRDAAPDPVFPAGHRTPAYTNINSATGAGLPDGGGRLTAAKANALMKAAADKAAAAQSETEREASGMPTTQETLAALGLSESEFAKLRALISEGVQPDPNPNPEPNPTPEPTPAPSSPSARLPKATAAAEAIMLDPETLAKLQAQARLGMEAHNEMKKQKRDRVLDKAMDLGKFPPSRREHYSTMYDADPDGTIELLNRMAENAVPVDVLGYSGDAEKNKSEADRAYSAMGWE